MMRFLPVAACALILAGCQTTTQQSQSPQPTDVGFARLDGRLLANNPQLQGQFQYDMTICKAETDKAALSAGPIYWQGIVGAIQAQIVEDRQKEALIGIFKACMLQKGYYLTTRGEFESRRAAQVATGRSRR